MLAPPSRIASPMSPEKHASDTKLKVKYLFTDLIRLGTKLIQLIKKSCLDLQNN